MSPLIRCANNNNIESCPLDNNNNHNQNERTQKKKQKKNKEKKEILIFLGDDIIEFIKREKKEDEKSLPSSFLSLLHVC